MNETTSTPSPDTIFLPVSAQVSQAIQRRLAARKLRDDALLAAGTGNTDIARELLKKAGELESQRMN